MKVTVAGGYGVGLVMRVHRAPEAGESLSDGVLSRGHGGKGSNQAVAARRLGAGVALLTAVGDDAAGADAQRLWAQEGIDATGVRVVPDASTMTGFIVVDATGENRIIIAPGALEALTPEDAEAQRATIAGSDALIVSLEVPAAFAGAALRIAREEGVLTVFNPAPAKDVPADLWAAADIVTPNLTEARALLGIGDEAAPSHELASQLRARLGADVVLTLGGEGSVVADASGIRPVAAVAPDRVVDTTGAGDAFTAALTVGRLATGSLAAAAAFAAHAGAHTVARPDVIPALPRRDELPAF
ncbi:ribokinase [Microbacterium resistens]|uniref:ribokinase n=1 Tax=Microbacterium resistens TaxID=156977 RepID=UPI001C59B76D|nr:ribokinase [Microbacterium resistens]MBW1638479.1 ribokinase [Microbacterium resistens]